MHRLTYQFYLLVKRKRQDRRKWSVIPASSVEGVGFVRARSAFRQIAWRISTCNYFPNEAIPYVIDKPDVRFHSYAISGSVKLATTGLAI